MAGGSEAVGYMPMLSLNSHNFILYTSALLSYLPGILKAEDVAVRSLFWWTLTIEMAMCCCVPFNHVQIQARSLMHFRGIQSLQTEGYNRNHLESRENSTAKLLRFCGKFKPDEVIVECWEGAC